MAAPALLEMLLKCKWRDLTWASISRMQALTCKSWQLAHETIRFITASDELCTSHPPRCWLQAGPGYRGIPAGSVRNVNRKHSHSVTVQIMWCTCCRPGTSGTNTCLDMYMQHGIRPKSGNWCKHKKIWCIEKGIMCQTLISQLSAFASKYLHSQNTHSRQIAPFANEMYLQQCWQC